MSAASTVRIGIGLAAVVAGVAALTAGVVYLGVRSSLDPLERDCQAHLLQERRMAGIGDLFVESHYVDRESSEVIFVMDFRRADRRPHRARVECLYRAEPGERPLLSFDRTAIVWERVRDGDRWVPWRPPEAAAR